MTRHVEAVTEMKTFNKVTGWSCDVCGKTEEKEHWIADGFTFQYRSGEEDEMSVLAPHLCWDCYENEDLTDRIAGVVELLRGIAPHAEVVIANEESRALGAAPVPPPDREEAASMNTSGPSKVATSPSKTSGCASP